MKFVEWVEPYSEWSLGVAATVRITVEDAIKVRHADALDRGFCYVSDQYALDDFLAVHWARVVES